MTDEMRSRGAVMGLLKEAEYGVEYNLSQTSTASKLVGDTKAETMKNTLEWVLNKKLEEVIKERIKVNLNLFAYGGQSQNETTKKIFDLLKEDEKGNN